MKLQQQDLTDQLHYLREEAEKMRGGKLFA